MKGIKEQLLMRSLGLRWNEAYHAWSKNRKPYTSTQLFRYFKQEVILLAGKPDVPGEPPLTLSSPPEMQFIGTKSELAVNMKSRDEKILAKFKRKAYVERDRREAGGVGDRWLEMQRRLMLDIHSTLIGLRIEMLFEYTEIDGTTYLDWCHGEVTLVIGDKSKYANVR